MASKFDSFHYFGAVFFKWVKLNILTWKFQVGTELQACSMFYKLVNIVSAQPGPHPQHSFADFQSMVSVALLYSLDSSKSTMQVDRNDQIYA